MAHFGTDELRDIEHAFADVPGDARRRCRTRFRAGRPTGTVGRNPQPSLPKSRLIGRSNIGTGRGRRGACGPREPRAGRSDRRARASGDHGRRPGDRIRTAIRAEHFRRGGIPPFRARSPVRCALAPPPYGRSRLSRTARRYLRIHLVYTFGLVIRRQSTASIEESCMAARSPSRSRRRPLASSLSPAIAHTRLSKTV